MADFVAVIRRAVDGLSDNTPEMRVKVYERARGAVQRQLESMKPRPPESMLQRQLEKLEAAIRDVESEHAEAGPAADIVEQPDVQGFASEAVEETVSHAEPAEEYREPEDEPVYEAPAAPAYEEPAHQEPAYEAPVAVDAEPVHHVEEPVVAAAAQDPVESWREETHWRDEAAPEVEEQASHHHPVHEPEVAEVAWHPEPPADIAASIDALHHQLHDTAPAAVTGDHLITETHSDPARADHAGHFDDVWAESAVPEAGAHEAPAVAELSWPTPAEPGQEAAIPVHYPPALGFASHEPSSARMPEAAEPFAWEAATFDDLPPVRQAAAPAAKPVLPKPVQPTPTGDYDDVDLFSDVHGGAAKPAAKSAQTDGWNELKELSGYDKFETEAAFEAAVPQDLDQVSLAGMQGKSYRMAPRRRRIGAVGIVATLVGVAVVGGAGYAGWTHRAALNSMVNGLVSSATKNANVADKVSTPAQPAATASGAATTPASGAAKPSTAAGTNVAALDNDGNTVNTKFTQRLMADGSEVDAGQPPVPGGPVSAEGKSIAQQNVAATTPAAPGNPAPAGAAPATPAPAATPAAPTATTTPAAATSAAATTPSVTPPVAGQTATVGTPEKMFLYEERLGQTSPTAIEGTVTWSVQQEKGDDGKSSPTVQGNINVPDRGMTALVTLKRNTDPSLPASHLIEIVFSLPPNFEGGAIESVQRVAMKATEQDRGDPLVAVPAKITDDFHMVALNDFPDARKTNLDLLRSRDWIDIPITYRNGRRALLTMEKGKTGTDAFDKVIGEWAAMGGANNGQ